MNGAPQRPFAVLPTGTRLHATWCPWLWNQHDGSDRTDVSYLTHLEAGRWLQGRRSRELCAECRPGPVLGLVAL